MDIEFTVEGKAQPAGSKSAFPILEPNGEVRRGPTGRIMTRVKDSNPKAGEWKQQVAYAARRAYQGPLLDGPLSLELVFWRVRPRGHLGMGRNAGVVKASAPAYPDRKPDLTKLERAVEDALTGVIWTDDARVVEKVSFKYWGEAARVDVRVYELKERVGDADST